VGSGRRTEQQLLGVRNACALVRAFAASGFESVVADMVALETVHLYRPLDTGAVIVALRLSFEEAQRRASTRVRHITDAEFHSLYVRATATSGLADVVLDVDSLDISAQVRLIERVWAMHGATITPTISEGE
jgi:hypothetical protein